MFSLVILVLVLLLVRIAYVLFKIYMGDSAAAKRDHPVKTVIIIGSGGHTAEMLRLVKHMNHINYSPRTYIMASTDTTSEVKITEMENTFMPNDPTMYEIVKIPRSRHVGQSYITSVFTTLYALIFSFPFIISRKPELVLCNGPGTCIPICAIAFLLRLLFITNTRIVFIESICRVKSLSLSGKILQLFADEILVQWPQLQEVYMRTKYLGRLA